MGFQGFRSFQTPAGCLVKMHLRSLVHDALAIYSGRDMKAPARRGINDKGEVYSNGSVAQVEAGNSLPALLRRPN